MPGDGGAARCCTMTFTTGLTALFMWLSLRTHKPTCSIQRFYVPALDTSRNSSSNHTISFDLNLHNLMKDKGVDYDTINLTFSYTRNRSTLPVAACALPGFYQGHGKKATRKNLAVNATGLSAVNAVSNGSTAVFRVDLATRVKYKILRWYTKRERVAVGGDVGVGSSGEKVGKKGVKLKSKSKSAERQWEPVGECEISRF